MILLTFCRVFWLLRVPHHLPCLKYEALPLFSLMVAPFVCGNEWMLKDFILLPLTNVSTMYKRGRS